MPGPLESPEVLTEEEDSRHHSESIKLVSLEMEVMNVHFLTTWVILTGREDCRQGGQLRDIHSGPGDCLN